MGESREAFPLVGSPVLAAASTEAVSEGAVSMEAEAVADNSVQFIEK
jgi:hypothetical protein